MIAIVGASGSGKSTLMNLLGCLDLEQWPVPVPRSGYRDPGCPLPRPVALPPLRLHLSALPPAAAPQCRRQRGDPTVYAGTPRAERQARSQALLTRLGLSDRSHHTPSQLSGGQQQRVSIARALANGGEVILADEPTGALDSQSGKEVMAILKELHAQGHTIILVTHDMEVASHADRIITLKDGRVQEDSTQAGTSP